MSKFRTEQEAFWAGDFGDEYTKRNQGPRLLASNLALFAQALRVTDAIGSVLELGANIGNNLQALRLLLPAAELHGVEINPSACAELARLPGVQAVNASILGYTSERSFDLVLIKGVLIHIDPQVLAEVYDTLFAASRRYILLVEYYNPTPVEVSYRGHEHRLFKRDFAGELRQRHSGLQLLDYGFVYRGDAKWPGDDMNWFLLEKR